VDHCEMVSGGVLGGDVVFSAPPGLELETRTTMMVRNFPNCYTRSDLIKVLHDHGFGFSYNLVYLPIDFSTSASFGYAFVNFVSSAEAMRFQAHLQGFSDWGVKSQKVCDVAWSDANQGLVPHVERYRNSPMMHPSVPDEFKPILCHNGMRVPFPPPTKQLRAPRNRRNDATQRS